MAFLLEDVMQQRRAHLVARWGLIVAGLSVLLIVGVRGGDWSLLPGPDSSDEPATVGTAVVAGHHPSPRATPIPAVIPTAWLPAPSPTTLPVAALPSTPASLPPTDGHALGSATPVPGGTPGQHQIVPPRAVLAIEGQEQVAGIGSYCWSRGNEGLCVDTEGIATAHAPLPARTPVRAHLRLPLVEPPTVLQLHVLPVTTADELPATTDGYRWWRFPDTRFSELPRRSQQEVELALSPGLYVLVVSAWWETPGSAGYGFLLHVR